MSSYFGPNFASPPGINAVGNVGLLDTTLGISSRIDAFHNLNVSIRTVLVDNQFTTTLDTAAWTVTSSGTGSASTATGAMVLSTGTTANSTASMTSAHRARLISGTTNIWAMAVRSTHPAGTANNTQRLGCYTVGGEDGIFVQTNGTTFQVGYRIAGVDTLSSFNGIKPTSLLGTWEIGYAQGGFVVWQNGVVVHRSLSIPAPIFLNPNFFTSAENVNSGGGTTDVVLTVLGTAIQRMGEAVPRPRFLHINTNGTFVVKQGPCTLHSIIVGIAGGSGNTATIYDNTAASGTVISVLDTTGSKAGQAVNYDLDMDTGLTVVVAIGTAADITVIFS